jgi:tyrosyl-tRNA synthetase
MQAKLDLARRIVADFHSKEAAEEAARHFDSVIRKKEMPDEIPEKVVASGAYSLSALLLGSGLASSRTEAKRLIEQAAVSIDGRRVEADEPLNLAPPGGLVLKVGKRKFVRVVVKA